MRCWYAAAVTADGTAIVVTDVLDGRLLWSDNIVVPTSRSDHPTSIAVGPFGATGRPDGVGGVVRRVG